MQVCIQLTCITKSSYTYQGYINANPRDYNEYMQYDIEAYSRFSNMCANPELTIIRFTR